MILSKKFVSDYINIDKDIKTIAEDMTKVGNEVESYKSLTARYKLVIGEIVSFKKHEKSDHLNICEVNVGSKTLQIVCGAPNVRDGLKTIVALSGCILPMGEIKDTTILGIPSSGMCCSLEELGIDKKYLTEKELSGICELPNDAVPGEDPIKYLELDDEIIDFDLTANRSDLLSEIGLAYELGAIYGLDVKEPNPVYNEVESDFISEMKLDIKTDKVKAFLLSKVENVTIKESPLFIKNRLIASGIRPINNVVDISNYIMLETGQPLHYYDADKVGTLLGVRLASEGEKLVTLDNNERTLNKEDIVIFNNEGAIGLAGVMGGLSTEITNDTKNILIEAAIFYAGTIRRTAKRVLRSEASSRFEKGLDVKRTYLAMERSKELLEKYADATILSGMIEYNTLNSSDKEIEITLSKINSVLGMNLSVNDVVNVFDKLKFKTVVNGETLTVSVPSRRLDISIKEDLIEEVGRIVGVDTIEATLPKTKEKKGFIDKYLRDIKVYLSSIGLNETLTYSLVSSEDANRFTLENKELISTLEPLTMERSTLRNNITSSLLDVYNYNKARNNKNINIFEIGEVFYKENDMYIEENHLAILLSGELIKGINTKIESDFYYLKGMLENLLDYLGYKGRYEFILTKDYSELHPYAQANILVDNKSIGFIGKINPTVISENVYVLEINLNTLRSISTSKIEAKDINKYPEIKKDVSFIVESDILSSDIIKSIKRVSSSNLKDVYAYDEYKNGLVKSITFALVYNDENKTLTDEEVMNDFNNMISSIEKEFNAKLKGM